MFLSRLRFVIVVHCTLWSFDIFYLHNIICVVGCVQRRRVKSLQFEFIPLLQSSQHCLPSAPFQHTFIDQLSFAQQIFVLLQFIDALLVPENTEINEAFSIFKLLTGDMNKLINTMEKIRLTLPDFVQRRENRNVSYVVQAVHCTRVAGLGVGQKCIHRALAQVCIYPGEGLHFSLYQVPFTHHLLDCIYSGRTVFPNFHKGAIKSNKQSWEKMGFMNGVEKTG